MTAPNNADLRELTELSFARFDAKSEQRLAQGLASLETKLVRWMVGLWATALLAMIGLSLQR
jgi:hypothetical protein